MIEENLIRILHSLDTCREQKIADLKEAVAIKSVSGSLKYATDILKTIRWAEHWLKRIKAHHECHEIGKYELDGKTVELPWVILAKCGNDPSKKTVCVYCHYDVVDANGKNWVSDGWNLQSRDGRLYGRGALKGKGALLSWFHCIEAFLKLKIELPVNIKFIIEGMFESGSIGLEKFLYSQRLTFMGNIDCITLCESEWLTEKVPCIVFGTVGISIFDIMCSSNGKDVLNFLTSNLVDKHGKILIDNLNNDATNLNPLIEQAMDQVQLDLDELKQTLPDYMQGWGQRRILTRLWRQPSLTFNNIEGDENDDEMKQRFVLKLVSALTPDRCRQFIWDRIKYLICHKFGANNEILASTSKNGLKLTIELRKNGMMENKITCHNPCSSRPWEENIALKYYKAARNAIRSIYKQEPNFIRDMNQIPAINILKGLTNKNIILLPLGNSEMDQNGANECITLRSFTEGKKMLAAYLFELGKI